MAKTEQIIAQSIDGTIRTDIKRTPELGLASILLFLSNGQGLISPWWSRQRDLELAKFWRSSDHLAGVIFAIQSRLASIPYRVKARDMSIRTHVKISRDYTDLIQNAFEYGRGFQEWFSKFIEDYLTSDNGAFAEVIGAGQPDGPIEGPAIAIAHLDSQKCMRTGNAEYPVLYTDISGMRYKLHHTRVIFGSQMPSSRIEMRGVGYCAVSRTINAAQNLIDMSIYKQEKLGSRPNRQLMITRGGLDPEDLELAINSANMKMTNSGETRFAKSIAVGHRDLPEADMKSIDLAGIPDGFSEMESTTLGMAVVALGFGVDAREIFPPIQDRTTKADAIIQHVKQRGRTFAEILSLIETQFNNKFLPPFLKMEFDFQDDAQDRQEAEIHNTRAMSRQRNLDTSVTNIRIERQRMVQSGEITDEQFEELELDDQRLVDGTDVRVLYFSEDSSIKEMMSGVNKQNIESINAARDNVMLIISVSKSPELVKKARRVLACLRALADDIDPEPDNTSTSVSSSLPMRDAQEEYQNDILTTKRPVDAVNTNGDIEDAEAK